MKRMLGFVLALAVMAGMSMPTFAQEKVRTKRKRVLRPLRKKQARKAMPRKQTRQRRKNPRRM